MKKILLPILALSGLLFASSCQMDEPDAGTLTGEVDFTITAGIPGGITTYADPVPAFSHLGGANNVDATNYDLRYILEVYDGETLAYRYVQSVDENFTAATVNFNARLLAKSYTFVLWADFVNEGLVENLYYNADNLKEIFYTETVRNDVNTLSTDIADAYSANKVIDLSTSSKSESITLTRPFGKIRLLATDKDIANKVSETPVSVKLDFGSAKFPSSFNALKGDVTDEIEIGTITTSAVPENATSADGSMEYDGAYLLGYVYTFASTPQSAYPIDVTVYSDAAAANQIGHRELTNIPVSANKLTTVVGNFYSNEGNIEVVVEDKFGDGEEEVPVPIVIGSLEELSKAFLEGGDYMLSSDIDIPENQIVKISKGTTTRINLNGHTLSTTNSEGKTFQDMFEVVGTLNISNGTVQFEYTGDNMGWDGGTAVFNVHGGGILNMEDVVVNDLGGTDMSFCVHLNNWGDVTLNADNCEFNSEYCGVRVFNSGPQKNNVMITNSKLTGDTRAFWVHNYIGDISDATEEEIKNRLNIDIYNNNNTFSLTGTAISPIRYGFDNPVYFTEKGELVDLVIDDSEKTVQISSASAMSAFAVMVNNGKTFENYTVTLDADIDLNNVAWTPIGPNGDGKNKFMGTFDGCNHTISNLKVTQEAGYHAAGLFGALNGTVKNLIIDGATIENLSSGPSTVNGTAVVAGSIYNSGLIDKVTVKNATVQGNRYLGGISGYVYGSITNCYVENIKLVATPDNLTGEYDNGDKVGGIVGYIVKDGSNDIGTVENCTVKNATIQGYRDIGGIAGCANSSEGKEVVINGCSVSDITLTQDFANGYKTTAADVSTIGSIFGRGYIAESNVNNETDISILVKVYDSETAQLALDAASSARTIEFADGTYDMTKLTAIAGKTLTFVGAGENTVFDYSSQIYGNYVNGGNGTFVFKNMTIKRSTETFAGMAHTASTSYENCTITGTYYVYETTAKFTDCKFKVTGDFYNCWLYGTSSATYEKCEFNCSGKSIYVDGNGEKGSSLTTNTCIFYDNGGVDNKAAIETGNTYGKRYSLTINNTEVKGFSTTEAKSPAVEGAELGTNVWGNKNYMTKDQLSVTIDGTQVY